MTGKQTVAVVVGTRPEIIKMAPVIRALVSSDRLRPELIHTNQHYDSTLSDVFFENLGLPAPDYELGIESGSQGEQTGRALVELEAVFLDIDPSVVLAQGDTNTVLAAAVAASKLPAVLGHVEAGIRSYDRSMPEEVNRVVADHLSDLLFAPTESAAQNLASEGIRDGVTVTGNTIVDACTEHTRLAADESDVLERFDITPGTYVVATIHRERNTRPGRLRDIVAAFDEQTAPILFPAHPRTREALDALDYDPGESVRLLEPLDYFDFLRLASNARLIVTDSGGIQEEASILEVPCLTVRPNTERPETVDAGVNRLVSPAELPEAVRELFTDDERHAEMVGHPHLYGDGTAGSRIVRVLE